MEYPIHAPEPGFYYHYKHDPQGEINNYAYEVLNIGSHTESDEFLVVYRPLYPSSVYTAGKMWDIRPLAMFIEKVEKEGKVFSRFQKITDPNTILKLERIRESMYGNI